MAAFRLSRVASSRVEEIHRYTRQRWGERQADSYIAGMFDAFAHIAAEEALSRRIPADFGVDGFFLRHEHHVIYWRRLEDGDVGIVTVLQERMHQAGRLREDFGP